MAAPYNTSLQGIKNREALLPLPPQKKNVSDSLQINMQIFLTSKNLNFLANWSFSILFSIYPPIQFISQTFDQVEKIRYLPVIVFFFKVVWYRTIPGVIHKTE